MSGRVLAILAAGGSAALLVGAYGFQHIGGLMPCQMCLWQRWPHGAASVVGLLIALGLSVRLAWLGALAAAATGGIGVYHAGVELGLWEGPAACSGGSGLGELSGADLLSVEAAAPIVLCTDVAWSLAGISMAGWNAILSFALMALWIAAARRA